MIEKINITKDGAGPIFDEHRIKRYKQKVQELQSNTNLTIRDRVIQEMERSKRQRAKFIFQYIKRKIEDGTSVSYYKQWFKMGWGVVWTNNEPYREAFQQAIKVFNKKSETKVIAFNDEFIELELSQGDILLLKDNAYRSIWETDVEYLLKYLGVRPDFYSATLNLKDRGFINTIIVKSPHKYIIPEFSISDLAKLQNAINEAHIALCKLSQIYESRFRKKALKRAYKRRYN